MSDIVHVAVAVIINDKDEVCISLRHKDLHQGGLWEFPGGKIKSEESVEQALNREIKEELDLLIESSRPLITINHDYQDKKVCLHVRKALDYSGDAIGVEGQQVKWLPVDQLSLCNFPAANLAIIKAIQLPDKYLITGKFTDLDNFSEKLKNALDDGIKLVQLRLKKADLEQDNVQQLVCQAVSMCSQAGAKLLFNIPQDYLPAIDFSNLSFDGFHADSRTLQLLKKRPEGKFFSASCYNEEEINKAKQLAADFIVLSPVQKTASHPEMPAMGWPTFSSLLETCDMPVYALGGVSVHDIEKSWSHGAQGVAAISAFWH
jgi:8-oxo-dGTP diphosphatase